MKSDDILLGLAATVLFMATLSLGGHVGQIYINYGVHGIGHVAHNYEDSNFTLVSTSFLGYLLSGFILYFYRKHRDLISWWVLAVLSTLGFGFGLSEAMLFFGIPISFPYFHLPFVTVLSLWAFLGSVTRSRPGYSRQV